MEYTTKRGFKFTVKEDVKDDWDFFEAACELDKGDLSQVKVLLVMLLGEDGFNALKAFHTDENGKLKASIMLDEFESIMDALKDTPEKN